MRADCILGRKLFYDLGGFASGVPRGMIAMRGVAEWMESRARLAGGRGRDPSQYFPFVMMTQSGNGCPMGGKPSPSAEMGLPADRLLFLPHLAKR